MGVPMEDSSVSRDRGLVSIPTVLSDSAPTFTLSPPPSPPPPPVSTSSSGGGEASVVSLSLFFLSVGWGCL